MQGRQWLFVMAGVLALSADTLKMKPMRLGVVSIQNRTGRNASMAGLDGRLIALLKKSGVDTVPLRFAPPADVDHAARAAKCEYILYTDVVSVRPTAGSQVRNAARKTVGAKSKDAFETEVEFRLFAMDEALPMASGATAGKSKPESKRESVPEVTVTVRYETGGEAVATPNFTQQAGPDGAPVGSPLASNAARFSALTSAFERTAKAVKIAAESAPKQSGN